MTFNHKLAVAGLAGKRLRDYLLFALFGTALGPLVSLLAVEVGLPGVLGAVVAGAAVWISEPGPFRVFLIPALSAVLIIAGLARGQGDAVPAWWRVLKHPGRLPSEFVDTEGAPAGLINMGVMGLLMWGYCLVVGADLNGPARGGIFTVIGFAAFGKHPRNV